MNNLLEIFSYAFMIRAFFAGIIISLCASLLGVSMVLRKNSMIGDGLSHVGFGCLAIATVLGFAPLEFTIPIVVVVSFFILKLNDNHKIHGDSAIALISASSLAIGIMAISIVKGVNTDINSYLFGSILSIGEKDLILSIILGIIILILFIISYNKIFALTFDESFAKSIGIKTNVYNIILSVLCSITIVLGMRIVGALLISSLIIFPCLSARCIFKNYKSVMISSGIISCICFTIGLIVSFIFDIPTGASIVVINLGVLLLFMFISFLKLRLSTN